MEMLHKKLMNWASILEEQTLEQARRTASMPFIFPHLALMPDAHLGKGSTVGSVIPTLGAIIPAAVGVDIGCFHGDTRVPLLNGRQRSLRELAEGEGPYWVYSLDEDRHIVPGRAEALRTRTDAELMRITVSGGDEIICTPDHPFMMSDGIYREARRLRFNDSLMPLVHHRNHVHFDNEPGNLELLDARQHSSHHRRARPSFDHDSAVFQERRLAGIRRSAADPVRQEAANPAALRWHKRREHGYNHKVIAVEFLTGRADVYCLQVEKYHNFALAAGVFVHNCGMQAVRTQFTAGDARRRGDLASLREAVENAIPLSAGKYNTAIYSDQTAVRIDELEGREGAGSAESIAPNWRLQLGSLGSGNHFIEVSLDEEDRVWLFLHSGSRGVGNKLAVRHIKAAQALCRKWWISLPDPDLAYLVEGTGEFWDYIRDLRWAQHFALLNREEMMHRVIDCFAAWIGRDVEPAESVNCHHNYTAQEKHFGKDVWLSRKGAIDASEGTPGLIPGSMGTRSYVVVGKGNRLALNSSPHGAGREYSRSRARKEFTRAQLDAAMEGIEWRHSDAFLDEIPGAYKPIDVVMEDAKDLVEVRHTLRQIVNVKGD
jgi:tRNA-splicing ligase RtcB (3'-phosphate/5'-hydroxy nucleic acid ligase)